VTLKRLRPSGLEIIGVKIEAEMRPWKRIMRIEMKGKGIWI